MVRNVNESMPICLQMKFRYPYTPVFFIDAAASLKLSATKLVFLRAKAATAFSAS